MLTSLFVVLLQGFQFQKFSTSIFSNLQTTKMVCCSVPSVVIAYLMMYQSMSYDQAYSTVISGRPSAKPNAGFEAQLRQLDGIQGLGVSSIPLFFCRFFCPFVTMSFFPHMCPKIGHLAGVPVCRSQVCGFNEASGWRTRNDKIFPICRQTDTWKRKR